MLSNSIDKITNYIGLLKKYAKIALLVYYTEWPKNIYNRSAYNNYQNQERKFWPYSNLRQTFRSSLFVATLEIHSVVKVNITGER